MKRSVRSLAAVAVAGMLVGVAASNAYADTHENDGAKKADANGCSGKDGCNGKDSCKGKEGCNSASSEGGHASSAAAEHDDHADHAH